MKKERASRSQAKPDAPDATPLRKGRWRWAALAIIAGIAIGAGVYLYPRAQAYAGPVRHVIVVSLDTARADHFGCYGNSWIGTPNLDALAKESILFSDYITVVTTTLSSHVSLFTGKYPHTHGVPRNGFMVNRDNVMLAEILHDAGFYTAGFLGSFALDSRFDFAQGFDHYDENFDVLAGTGGTDQNQRRAAAVTDAAIEYLDTHELPDHLFLFVHYFDPHTPYTPPPPYDTMYGDASRRVGWVARFFASLRMTGSRGVGRVIFGRFLTGAVPIGWQAGVFVDLLGVGAAEWGEGEKAGWCLAGGEDRRAGTGEL